MPWYCRRRDIDGHRARRCNLASMDAWRGAEVPDLPGSGPEVRLHDTATGEARRRGRRAPGVAVRLRDHPVRRDAHGPRRDLHRLGPAGARLARRGARGRLRAERHRRGRPAARAGRTGRRGLVAARAARDRPVPRRHGGAAQPAARRTSSAPWRRSRSSTGSPSGSPPAARSTTSTATSTSPGPRTRSSARWPGRAPRPGFPSRR